MVVKTAPLAASLLRFGSGGWVCGELGSRILPSISSAIRNRMLGFPAPAAAAVAMSNAVNICVVGK